jgi:small subunit ribosomal protein S1
MFKEGDTIEAKVIHVSADERRLGLSIKQTKEEPVRSGGGKSKSFGGDSVSAGSTLGDLLREKLEEAAGDALAAAEEEEAEAAEAAVEEAPVEEAAESEAPAEEAAAEEEETK